MADTIFAKASGHGRAGVAVYRLSGPAAFPITRELIGMVPAVRRAVFKTFVDPDSGLAFDDGLALTFKGPASFTGEDVAEFQLHGAISVEAALYQILTKLGARPAEAGEFTLRALKNGKMDLAQVEALADLIDSETSSQNKQALGQLHGRLSAHAARWRQGLIEILTPLEAEIDFPDEEGVPDHIAAAAVLAIDHLMGELETFLEKSTTAKQIRDGVRVAIIGAPNAGKSSLLNALSGSERAIVSDMAGTTRDIVEARLDLGGMLVTLIDTAGIRDASGAIEREGIKRAKSAAADADMRLLLVASDGTGFDQRSLLTSLLRKGDLILLTKSDLKRVSRGTTFEILGAEIGELSSADILEISSETGDGIDALIKALTARFAQRADIEEGALTRARHSSAVSDAIIFLKRAKQSLKIAPELAAEVGRLAARALGSITGDVGVEDVLGEIFSSFCIGK